jgi:hypothetical protein
MRIEYVSRAIGAWCACVVVTVGAVALRHAGGGSTFFRFGPHEDLRVLGVAIDRAGPYTLLVCYSFVNAVVRAVHANVLVPWLVNNVQDVGRPLGAACVRYAYEVSALVTLYHWIDWLLYMSILLAQVDMFLIELTADLLATTGTTYVYISMSKAAAAAAAATSPSSSADDTQPLIRVEK